jgi:hypothetical protein
MRSYKIVMTFNIGFTTKAWAKQGKHIEKEVKTSLDLNMHTSVWMYDLLMEKNPTLSNEIFIYWEFEIS